MNCLDFRRLCLIEPTAREPRIYMHLFHCPACRAYRKKVLAGEQQVASAMQVPVPDGLDRKIVFSQAMQSNTDSRWYWGRWQAAAVALVLVMTLAVVFSGLNAQRNVVPDLAMHMADDTLHMAPPQADVSQRIDQVMRHLGGHWAGSKVAITHVKLCLVRERAAAHFVVAGQRGPVTVFLVPRMQAQKKEGLPVDGQLADVAHIATGSIALFGYDGENLDRIREQFSAAVQWSEKLARKSSRLRLAAH